jgi:hypothetical protein
MSKARWPTIWKPDTNCVQKNDHLRTGLSIFWMVIVLPEQQYDTFCREELAVWDIRKPETWTICKPSKPVLIPRPTFYWVNKNIPDACQGVHTPYVHGAGSTDSFTTRTTEGQGRVMLVLDLDQGIQDHRANSVQVEGVLLQEQ